MKILDFQEFVGGLKSLTDNWRCFIIVFRHLSGFKNVSILTVDERLIVRVDFSTSVGPAAAPVVAGCAEEAGA